MPDTSRLSEARLALLEKYLHQDFPQGAMAAGLSEHGKAKWR